ncbi:MAG: hypothetical protein Q8N03_13010 [Ignavibacteria bacterium]|nr:hypothetical protein [Ignavibacteria bacterium]
MYRTILLLIFVSIKLLSQEGYYSVSSRISFADYLLCNRDYEFAINEYNQIDKLESNDTIKFKLAFSYFKNGEFESAKIHFDKINNILSVQSKEYSEAIKFLINEPENYLTPQTIVGKKLVALNSLYQTNKSEDDLSTIFTKDDFIEIDGWLNSHNRINEKSILLAGIYSSLLPGLGKIYSGQTGDGITAFVVTSLLSYLSYDNFKNNHDFRGYLFGSLAGLFYAGNIYGSVVSAHQFNLKVKLDREDGFFSFLKLKNYFLTEPSFIQCR